MSEIDTKSDITDVEFNSSLELSFSEEMTNNNNNNKKYGFVFLFASPLVRLNGQEMMPLNMKSQINQIEKSIMNSNKQIYFKVNFATESNLVDEISQSPVILHYSGHSDRDYLAFEDNGGRMKPLKCDDIYKIFSSGNVKVFVVILDSCKSENIGNALIAAGVEHVIATKNVEINDEESKKFTSLFHKELLEDKKTIREAFDLANNNSERFLLLPTDGNHDVTVFSDCPDGEYEKDDDNDLSFNGCNTVPIDFVGRNVEIQLIYHYFRERKSRWVTINGEKGMGKTVLASRACEYMNERKLFDAIYYVPLTNLGAINTNDMNALAEIFGSCMDKEFLKERNTNKTWKNRNVEDLVNAFKDENNVQKNFLFVIDDCDNIFVEGNGTTSIEDVTTEPAPMGLIKLLDRLFLNTDNVKIMLVAAACLLGTRNALFVDVAESEKFVTLPRLDDEKAARLLVHLVSRPLIRGSVADAVRTIKNMPVLKELEGNPRAIKFFSNVLKSSSSMTMDSSEEMIRHAQDCLGNAKKNSTSKQSEKGSKSGAICRPVNKGSIIERLCNDAWIKATSRAADRNRAGNNNYAAMPTAAVKWRFLFGALVESLQGATSVER